jgi:PilZ domain
MYYAFHMSEERRGLRFPFIAGAEVFPEDSPQIIPARVTELSLRGCFLEFVPPLKLKQSARVKIFHRDEFFEATAEVIYVRPNGVGVVFEEMKPHFRSVVQAWILSALDKQTQAGEK